MLFEMFGCQGYSSNCKLTTVNQGMTNWSDNSEKIASGSSLKLTFSESSREIVRGF